MAEIDTFATVLLEEAKRFLEKAADDNEEIAKRAHLHAALMLGFCSLEAHLNSIAEELAARPEFSMHEKGLLLEKEVRLEHGEYELGGLRMSKMEDRILFLYRRFSGKKLDKAVPWWAQLKQATESRNKLTHPKQPHIITVEMVSNALKAMVDVLDVLYRTIYQKPFPAAGFALDSQLNF